MTDDKKAVVESNKERNGFFSRTYQVLKVGYETFVEEYPNELRKHPSGQSVIDFTNKTTETVSEAYKGVTDATGKIIDNISGAEAQQQIAALLEKQRRYNDILATRLAEALDRIEKLEQQVAKLSHER